MINSGMEGVSFMHRKYGIGLDIGTSSIGWTVVDEFGHVIRVKGQTGLGVRLFREGQPAAERRTFRTTRRRLSRRRWRLRLLREFFDPYIAAQDSNFFARRKASSIAPRDPRFTTTYQIFNDRSDQDYYQDYPTIYHLRQALMTEKRPFDIREIYLAIHHIVKYRGHFLTGGAAKDFQPGKLDLATYFETINAQLAALFIDQPHELPTLDWAAAVTLLTDDDQSRNDRQKALTKMLVAQGTASDKKFYTEMAKAIVGLKAKLGLLTGVADQSEQKTLTFSLETLEDHQDDVATLLGDEQIQLVNLLARLHAALQLAVIIPSGTTFSGQMVQRYQTHQKQLTLLKAFRNQLTDAAQRRQLKQAYSAYIANDLDQEGLVKALQKVVSAQPSLDERGQQLQAELAQGDFLPKQRTKSNGVIPHQVQQQELDQIIRSQSAYYPWLAETNPVTSHQSYAPYKLDELVDFRVPYYVGPLVHTDANQTTAETRFSWMTRRDADDKTPITPWNFDQQVDRQASANAFIQRMKTTDTYLLGEDVLPQNSLLYQRFEVLNELNNVRVNGDWLTPDEKQRVFRELFRDRAKATVTIEEFKKNLIAHGAIPERLEVKGLADPHRFLSSLTTYHDYLKIIPEALSQADKQADIEKIINWSTVFEDTAIFKEKLQEIGWLTATQRQQLARKRYRGWGQFSARLLTTLRDPSGRSVMDLLWAESVNFMQIIRRPEFQQAIARVNQSDLQQQSLSDTISELYTSPQNKKAIRQVLLVVADIQRAMHGVAPSWIFIEAARGADQNPQRTRARQQRLLDAYQVSAKDIVDEAVREKLISAIDDHQNFEDRVVLYFQQNGRDIYTGKPLDFESLSHYHIDHIIPQSIVKDDSLDNRVLTSNAENERKGARIPGPLYPQQEGWWRKLQRVGLISQRKLQHLTMRPEELDEHTTGFVARQLVETRQVIKLITNILSQQYDPEETKLVSIKAGLSHQFREKLNLPKLRDLNDYHHAHDAYLAARIGTYLLQRYPNLERFFVYGQYQKSRIDLRRHFNFIGEMLKGKVTDPVKILAPKTTTVIWDKLAEVQEVEHLMSLKHLLVTHEVYDNHGALFDQTIYSAKNPKNKKLIPRKANQPVELYGGYSGETTGYLAIVRTISKKKTVYQVKRVPTRLVGKLQRCSEAKQKQLLADWFAPEFVVRGKQQPFEVVAPHVHREQTVIDDIFGTRHQFGLGTNVYYRNRQQLVLPLKLQRNLVKFNPQKEELEEVYSEITRQVQQFFPLYQVRGFCDKLLSVGPDLTQLEAKTDGNKLDQRQVIFSIMQGLHANAQSTSFLTVKNFGSLVLTGGIKLTDQATLIDESPTGLFQRQIRLSDL